LESVFFTLLICREPICRDPGVIDHHLVDTIEYKGKLWLVPENPEADTARGFN